MILMLFDSEVMIRCSWPFMLGLGYIGDLEDGYTDDVEEAYAAELWGSKIKKYKWELFYCYMGLRYDFERI